MSVAVHETTGIAAASKAWELLEGRVAPRSVDVIKEKKSSAVYRLWFDEREAAVIAKRRFGEGAVGLVTERAIYDSVLPRMSSPHLRCHGLLADDGYGASWLFVEDAGPVRYDPAARDDRAALGRWLAELHTAGSAAAPGLGLPDRGPAPFRTYLIDGRETVVRHRTNPAFSHEERGIIDELIELLELIDANWDNVAAFCDGLPSVLVHGDLIPRNICVRRAKGTTQILAIDWEKAGWGIPSIDLAQTPIPSTQFAANAAIETYCSAVSAVWPDVDMPTIERAGWYATIFRCLAAVHWDARYLRLDWPHRTVAKMEYYRSALKLACPAVGLGGGR